MKSTPKHTPSEDDEEALQNKPKKSFFKELISKRKFSKSKQQPICFQEINDEQISTNEETNQSITQPLKSEEQDERGYLTEDLADQHQQEEEFKLEDNQQFVEEFKRADFLK